MTEEGHRHAAEELRTARARLLPDQDIRAYAQLSFGMAFHLVSVGAQSRHGVHRENHEGLGRWLRDQGHAEIGRLWDGLERVRIGRWYGRQGNGDTAETIDRILEQLENWALAEGSH